MSAVYLVTVVDYESSVIIGCYSTEQAAKDKADATNVYAFGRMGPYVIPLTIDAEQEPLWTDGDPFSG